MREILIAIGEDPDRDGLLATPERVAGAYEYLFAGLGDEPTHHLEVNFAEDHREIVLMRDVPLVSVCEHHLMPFVGKVHVGYAPGGRVVGFSELTRLVEGYARRPQLQERLTAQIAEALYEALGSRGSIVVVEAEHTCMIVTGAQRPGGTVAVTSAARGVYERDASLRAEAMALISRSSPQ